MASYYYMLNRGILMDRLAELGNQHERAYSLQQLVEKLGEKGIRVIRAQSQELNLPSTLELISKNPDLSLIAGPIIETSGLPYIPAGNPEPVGKK